jgi:hypothetical protein
MGSQKAMSQEAIILCEVFPESFDDLNKLLKKFSYVVFDHSGTFINLEQLISDLPERTHPRTHTEHEYETAPGTTSSFFRKFRSANRIDVILAPVAKAGAVRVRLRAGE